MKPLGRKLIHFPGKTDRHPPNGFINWWETDRKVNKRTARQKDKRDIAIDLASQHPIDVK